MLPLPETHRSRWRSTAAARAARCDEHILSPDNIAEAPAADWDDICASSTRPRTWMRSPVDSVDDDMQRRIGFPWSPEMVERSRRSVGATIAAARCALAARRHGREPRRRHAPRLRAIAAKATACSTTWPSPPACCSAKRCSAGGRRSTATCIRAMARRPSSARSDGVHVLDARPHNFPFRKEISDLDVEWPDGTGTSEYLAALEEHMPGVLARHRPDLVFYLAGADPYEHDRWGRLKLTMEGLRRRDVDRPAMPAAPAASRGRHDGRGVRARCGGDRHDPCEHHPHGGCVRGEPCGAADCGAMIATLPPVASACSPRAPRRTPMLDAAALRARACDAASIWITTAAVRLFAAFRPARRHAPHLR